ncbi:MAG: DUF3298 domain-containing protein [Ignavibacteria bacterium]|nr:DUF3298 domain-containing protein [Ignavibacteria bacterium]
MKKLFYPILIIAVTFSIFSCKPDTDKSGSNISESTSELKFEEKTLLKTYRNCDPQNENCTYIQIKYSLISQGQHQEIINSTITDNIISVGDPGKKSAEKLTIEEVADKFINEYENFLNNNKDYDLGWMTEIQGKPEFSNTKIICYSISNVYFLGGAHPNSNLTYLNFERKNGKLIYIPDIFSPGFEDKLNAAINSEFRKSKNLTPEDNLIDKAGLFHNEISYNNNFAVLREGIRFYYNPYEIAPYAAGTFEVTVPYELIEDIIPDDSPINF